jgi:CubicO group peptidase (beta-lactamase class C family)
MTVHIIPKRLACADALLQAGLEDGLFTHAVYGLICGGEPAVQKAFGVATLGSVFDLASLTKPLATATLIMQGVEQGRLHLRQPVARFFKDVYGPLPHLSGVEVRHLLTHTSGLPPIPCWPAEGAKASRQELIGSVLTTPTLRPAGVGYTYSDTGFILLGEIAAQVFGQPLEKCFQEQIAGPLGRTTLGFGPSAANVVPTGPEAAGVVHDPRARDLGGVAGHAGLFGTAADVLTFAEAIRTGGGPILSRASVARMRESQIPASVGAQSLGWFCAGNDYLPSGDLFSDRAFGHSGFTGTAALIDPESGVSLVLLTNRVVNQAEDGSRFLRARRLWLNAVAAALA